MRGRAQATTPSNTLSRKGAVCMEASVKFLSTTCKASLQPLRIATSIPQSDDFPLPPRTAGITEPHAFIRHARAFPLWPLWGPRERGRGPRTARLDTPPRPQDEFPRQGDVVEGLGLPGYGAGVMASM